MSIVIEKIAECCHEVNRVYSRSIGDTSHLNWDKAPQDQKDSAINGVRFHLGSPSLDDGPRASHENWMAEKLKQGWVYGVHKNAEFKTHPCLVPYAQLPAQQKIKDDLFVAVIKALS